MRSILTTKEGFEKTLEISYPKTYIETVVVEGLAEMITDQTEPKPMSNLKIRRFRLEREEVVLYYKEI